VIVQADVDRVVERVAALYSPLEVWVFGSFAKGNAHAGSDLDLLIVKPSDLPRPLRGRNLVSVLSATSPFGIDLVFVTPEEMAEELRQPYSLVSTVLPTATRVYPRQG